MSSMRASRLALAVVIAVLVLKAVPAYSALAIDPLTPTTLYAGTSRGVFKSTDGGASWSASGLINVSALAIDPSTPTTLYAATSTSGVFGGVYKSTDGGVSWNSIGGLPSFASSLAIDPLTPSTLYAGALGWLNGVYLSTVNGRVGRYLEALRRKQVQRAVQMADEPAEHHGPEAVCVGQRRKR